MFELLKDIFTALVGVVVSFIMVFTSPPGESPETPPEGTLSETPTEEIVRPLTPEEIEILTRGTNTKEEIPQETSPEIETKPSEVIVESISAEPTPVEVSSGIDISDLIITIPPIQTGALLTISEVNQKTREALVNIICTTKQGGLLNPITGSGITIDERGVILTNAHIAQYYLLKDYLTTGFIDCVIRVGSPARNRYKAELLFISPAWVKNNYQKIAQSNPKGTGEDDFALLLITERTNGSALPSTFPAVSPDMRGVKPKAGDSVVVAGYPAGFLGGIAIQKDLYAVSTVTEVMEIFTFRDNTLDLFSVGGNIAAQKGSSGGAITSDSGRLLGIIVTSSDATNTTDRDLRAITLFHINESLKSDSGIDLDSYLFGNLFEKGNQFNQVLAPTLTELLESALNQ